MTTENDEHGSLESSMNRAANMDQAELTARHEALSSERLTGLIARAEAVLTGNWMGGWTRPSPTLFPHQWNWDSGFVALGYLHLNPELAYHELRTLFQAQWIDGFLPHIVFNRKRLNHFPGPDYWRSDTSGRMPPGVYTSGIGQPPVHASILIHALRLDPDADRARAFLREMYPRLCELHNFYYLNRDPDDEGLVSIMHPWESGLDHSDVWREVLESLTGSSPWAEEMQARYDGLSGDDGRARCPYIAGYSYLVESLFTRGYHWKTVVRDHPFVIQNVLFNSVLCQAEHDLGVIAETIGEDAEPHRCRSERTAAAINDKLWCENSGMYCDWDVVGKRSLTQSSVFSFLPLYAGLVPENRLSTVCEALTGHCDDFDAPSLAATCGCQHCNCWRGSVWVNVCWYIVQGLRRIGELEEAERLVDYVLDLVDRRGFFEYFDPGTGQGQGEADFSWTAALVIDLAFDRLQPGARRPLQ